MRAILQRSASSAVTVDGKITGKIEKGLNILLGVTHDDTKREAELLARKTAELRIFEDENGKMNLSVNDVGGSALVISQFTLYADASHGRRPSFIKAAKPDTANELYEYYCKCLGANGIGNVQKGVFGADMQVEIYNDGPVTIILDTDELKPKSQKG